MIIPNSALDNGQGNCYYVESAGFVSIPDTWNTDYSGVVLVSTGVMQLVKLSPCDGLNGKNKYINLVSEQELYQGGKKIDTDKIEYVKIIPVKLTEGGSVAKRYKDKAIIVNLK